MKPTFTTCLVSGVAVLAAWAVDCQALTLGPMQGTVTVGQALDVSVPLAFDSAEDSCIEADVMYGDTRLPSSQVRIGVVETGGRTRARITSAVPVNEPVVVVAVRAGCAQASTRRYQLLADAPLTAPGTQVADSPPSGFALSQPSRAAAAGGNGSRAARAAEDALVARTAVAARAVPAAHVTRSQRRTAAGKVSRALQSPPVEPALLAGTTAELARPRLQLSVSDAGASPALRSSVEMLSQPTTDGKSRAAAAALWRTLNNQPQELSDTTERVKLLESQLAELRAMNSAAAAEAARPAWSWASFAAWAGALAALVILGAAGLLVYRWRSATARPAARWMESDNYSELPRDSQIAARSSHVPASSSMFPVADGQEDLPLPPLQPPGTPPYQPLFSSSPVPLAAIRQSRAGGQGGFMDEGLAGATTHASVEADGLNSAVAGLPAESPAAPPALAELAAQSQARERIQALIASQHQASLLAYMEQYDEAVDVLLAYIDSQENAPPLAFLDLLNLLRLQERREDYELWSDTLFCTYGCDAPRMEDMDAGDERLGPDDAAVQRYPAVMMMLTAAWPSPDVLPVIEELLLGTPDGIDLLSAAAYRELLWLHAIAVEVCGAPGNTAAPLEPDLQADPTNSDHDPSAQDGGLDFDLDAMPVLPALHARPIEHARQLHRDPYGWEVGPVDGQGPLSLTPMAG
ncbi:hypothetical protein BH11PSE7_BH11PSE7_33980 [soil metagenome]